VVAFGKVKKDTCITIFIINSCTTFILWYLDFLLSVIYIFRPTLWILLKLKITTLIWFVFINSYTAFILWYMDFLLSGIYIFGSTLWILLKLKITTLIWFVLSCLSRSWYLSWSFSCLCHIIKGTTRDRNPIVCLLSYQVSATRLEAVWPSDIFTPCTIHSAIIGPVACRFIGCISLKHGAHPVGFPSLTSTDHECFHFFPDNHHRAKSHFP
jgi:hypothetical protein